MDGAKYPQRFTAAARRFNAVSLLEEELGHPVPSVVVVVNQEDQRMGVRHRTVSMAATRDSR